jgi:hypothetical protein
VNQTTFNELHTRCVTALREYVASAEVTTNMLANCTPEPMSLGDRLDLLTQEVAEKDAHFVYTNLKRIIHHAARLGFHYSSSQIDAPESLPA